MVNGVSRYRIREEGNEAGRIDRINQPKRNQRVFCGGDVDTRWLCRSGCDMDAD